MAIAFKNTKGKALSNKVDSYAFKDGDNKVRLFGGVLPRYLYWVKASNGKDIPIECLGFDREKEKFTNVEHDFVPSYFPDKKCQWSYSIGGLVDGKAQVINLKKKLFEQILTAAEDLGDPTDPDTGWDICFKRVKTGPLPFNVEYQLQVLKCKPRALSEDERTAVATFKNIDEQYPRPTPEEVKALCEKVLAGAGEEETTDAEREAVSDLP